MQLSSVEKKKAKQKSFWMFLSCWELINLQSGPAWFWKRLVVVWSGSGGNAASGSDSETAALWQQRLWSHFSLPRAAASSLCVGAAFSADGVRRFVFLTLRIGRNQDRCGPRLVWTTRWTTLKEVTPEELQGIPAGSKFICLIGCLMFCF